MVVISTIFIPSAFADSISIEIDNIDYDVDYVGNNVVLKSAIADLNFISLIFETDVSESKGDVSITFQRDFFDAKIGYSDDDFFILSDGDEIEFEEIKNDESRTLSFSLSAGTEEIEIIGTILADNSFLIEQKQQQDNADAKAQADANAKLDEEEKLEKLMNMCGDGTIYENGECKLSPMEKNASVFRTGPLIYSIVIAMSLGIIITMILWGIGKRSHKVLSNDGS